MIVVYELVICDDGDVAMNVSCYVDGSNIA